MALFSAGQKLTAQLLNNAFTTAVADVQDTVGTLTSTGYTAAGLSGGVAAGVAFVAPSSGRVMLEYSSLMTNSASGNFTYSSPQIRTGNVVGSGTVVLTVADEFALTHQGTNQDRYGASMLVSGLTPGSSYNVHLLHRVTAGTGTVSRKRIAVLPLT